MAVECCASVEIPRVSGLPEKQFHDEYFVRQRPVIITDAADDWPARSWTIPSLVERVGDNEVWVRGKTNKEDYRVGRTYTIRRCQFREYCDDLIKEALKQGLTTMPRYVDPGVKEKSFYQKHKKYVI